MICIRFQNLKCFLSKASLHSLAFVARISFTSIQHAHNNATSLDGRNEFKGISWCFELENVCGLKQI